MRITRNQLRQIIQEELSRTLRESPSSFGHRYAEPTAKLTPGRIDTRRRGPSLPSSSPTLASDAVLMSMLPDPEEYSKMSDDEKAALAKELGSTAEKIEDLLKDIPK